MVYKTIRRSSIFRWFAVSIEDVSQIPFPAVSICYPKTMMYPAVSKVMARQIESSEENKTIETIIARDGCFNWPYYNGQGKDILWKAGDYSVINYKIKKMWSAEDTNQNWNRNFTELIQKLNQMFGDENVTKMGLMIHNLFWSHNKEKVFGWLEYYGLQESIKNNETALQNNERINGFICLYFNICNDDYDLMFDNILAGNFNLTIKIWNL